MNLIEFAEWVAGIYQLEESDVVQGGADGIDNLQAKQLANRTLYLKQQLEALASSIGGSQPADATLTAIAAVVTAADKLIYATAEDAFAATTLTAFARSFLDDVDAETARATLGLGTAAMLTIDTDGTLTTNSDTRVPSQKAVKTYVDSIIAAQDAMVFKGILDCSANPNYPAADRGHTYRVSVTGKIGGAAGVNVEAGDILICLTDGTATGNQATVGAAWGVIQANLDGALLSTAIGSTVQAYDADLAAIAALVSAADKIPYATGAETWALTSLTAFARTLLDDVDAAAARTTLGLGSVVFSKSQVRVNTANGYGSTNTMIRRFSNVVENVGADIVYADSAILGASFTIQTAGRYAISFSECLSGNNAFGITLNSAQLTTSISNAGLALASRVAMGNCNAANTFGNCGATLELAAGDVIRPHNDGAAAGALPCVFSITRVG